MRVVGLTTPEADSILVRLQSFAEDPLDVLVNTVWPVQRAFETTFLGLRRGELPVGREGIRLRVNPSGVAGVLLTLGSSHA